jgi:TP901 family phage tail tape measure protein
VSTVAQLQIELKAESAKAVAGLARAEQAVQKLGAAATTATTQINTMNAAMVKATSSVGKMATASTAAARAVDKVAASATRATTAANAVNAAVSKASASNTRLSATATKAASATSKLANAAGATTTSIKHLGKATSTASAANTRMATSANKAATAIAAQATAARTGTVAATKMGDATAAAATATDALRKASKSTAAQSGLLNKALNMNVSTITRMTSVALGARQVIGMGLAVGIALAAREFIRFGSNFESAFANVEKTVDGTEAQLASIRDEIRQLALEIPESAANLANMAGMAGQLGVEAENIAAFTRVIATLGVTTEMTGEDGAKAIARFMNVMQTFEGDVDRVASTLIHLGNNAAATESEIMNMAMRISGAGRVVGITEGQVMGFAAAMSSLGIRVEAGGSAATRMFLRMEQAVNSGGQQLSAFSNIANVSASEFAQAWSEDPMRAMQMFLNGLGSIIENGGDVTAALNSIGFTELRLTDAVRRLAAGSNVLNEMLEVQNEGWETGNKHMEEAERRYDTVASRWQMLKNQVGEGAIELFDASRPALVGMMNVAGIAFESMAQDAKNFAMIMGMATEAVQAFKEGWLGLPVVGGWLEGLFGGDSGDGQEEGANLGARIASGIKMGFRAATPGGLVLDLVYAEREKRAEEAAAKEVEIFRRAGSVLLTDLDFKQGRSHEDLGGLWEDALGERNRRSRNTRRLLESNLTGVDHAFLQMNEQMEEQIRAFYRKTDESFEEIFSQGLSSDMVDLFSRGMGSGSFDDLLGNMIGAAENGLLEWEDVWEMVGRAPSDIVLPAIAKAVQEIEDEMRKVAGDRDIADDEREVMLIDLEASKAALYDFRDEYLRIRRELAAPLIGPQISEMSHIFDAETQAMQRQEEELGKITAGYRASSIEIAAWQDVLERGGPEAVAQNLDFLVRGIADSTLAYGDFAKYVTQEATPEMIDAVDKLRDELDKELFEAKGDPEKMAEIQKIISVVNFLYGEQKGEINGVNKEMASYVSLQDQINNSLKENELKGTQRAIEYLLDAEERQGYLTEEQYRQYQQLVWAEERRAAGIQDDLVPAYIQAEYQSALYLQRQDELNKLLADGKITEEQHADALRDAALAGDAGTTAAYMLAEAQEGVAKAIDKSIDRIEDMLVKLNLIPARVDTEVRVTFTYDGVVPGFTEFGVGDTEARSLSGTGGGLDPGSGGEFHTGVVREDSEADKKAKEAERAAEQAARDAERAAQEAARFASDIIMDFERRIDPSYIRDLEKEINSLIQSREAAIGLGMGDDIVANITAEIEKKEAELALIGEIAGSAIGQGLIEEIERQKVADAFDELFSDLPGIVSGDVGKKLAEDLTNATNMAIAAEQAGMPELAAIYAAEAEAIASQLESLGVIMATPIVEGMLEEFAAAQIGEQMFDRLGDVLSGPSGAEKIVKEIEDLNKKIEIATARGVSLDIIAPWVEERDKLVDQAKEFWADVAMGAALGMFDQGQLQELARIGGQQFIDELEKILTPEAVERVLSSITIQPEHLGMIQSDVKTTLLGDSPEDAAGTFDSIIQAVVEGRLSMEDFMDFMESMPGVANSVLTDLASDYRDKYLKAVLEGNMEAAQSYKDMHDIIRGIADPSDTTGLDLVQARKEHYEKNPYVVFDAHKYVREYQEEQRKALEELPEIDIPAIGPEDFLPPTNEMYEAGEIDGHAYAQGIVAGLIAADIDWSQYVNLPVAPMMPIDYSVLSGDSGVQQLAVAVGESLERGLHGISITNNVTVELDHRELKRVIREEIDAVYKKNM